MFCPKCGSNQSDTRKFCTSCGTNLHLVSQTLTGQPQPAPPTPPAYLPPAFHQHELERRRQMAKGYKFALMGGGFLAYGLLDLITGGQLTPGPPFGVWLFFGLILLSVGLSKIISYREPLTGQAPGVPPNVPQRNPGSSQAGVQPMPPQPVFAPAPVNDSSLLGTNQLETPQHPLPSVVEDETLRLPSMASEPSGASEPSETQQKNFR